MGAFYHMSTASSMQLLMWDISLLLSNSEMLWISLHSLFTANNLESINEDAFLGLPHLEYL